MVKGQGGVPGFTGTGRAKASRITTGFILPAQGCGGGGVPQLQLSEVLLKDPFIPMLSADQNCVTLTPAVCHAVLRYMGQKPLGGWYLVSGYWRGQAHTNLSKKATELYNNQACE